MEHLFAELFDTVLRVDVAIMDATVATRRPLARKLLTSVTGLGSATVAASFPSGHATVTVYAMTARESDYIPFSVVAVLAVLVAGSRVYLGTHFPSATAAGLESGVSPFCSPVRCCGGSTR